MTPGPCWAQSASSLRATEWEQPVKPEAKQPVTASDSQHMLALPLTSASLSSLPV